MKKRPRPTVSGGRPPRPISLPRRGAAVTRRNYVKGNAAFKQQMSDFPVRWKVTDQSDEDEPEAIA